MPDDEKAIAIQSLSDAQLIAILQQDDGDERRSVQHNADRRGRDCAAEEGRREPLMTIYGHARASAEGHTPDGRRRSGRHGLSRCSDCDAELAQKSLQQMNKRAGPLAHLLKRAVLAAVDPLAGPRLSTTTTSRPAAASASAIIAPVMPAPITSTSVLISTVTGSCRSSRSRGALQMGWPFVGLWGA